MALMALMALMAVMALMALMALMAMMMMMMALMAQPLRRAAHVRTLWMSYAGIPSTRAQHATLLEGVVRCPAQQDAAGGKYLCPLRHVVGTHCISICCNCSS